MKTNGFTLIELLVVVAIIVVLLAILTPAMDRAIYMTELTVCATREKGITSGLLMYAMDYNRRYPYRPQASGDPGYKPNNTYIGNSLAGTAVQPDDDRVRLRNYMSINGHFNDPLSPREVDFEGSDPQTQIEISYHLWHGWKYHVSTGGTGGVGSTTVQDRGMFKIGDKFTWTADPGTAAARTYEFDFLASDVDGMSEPDADAISGHADQEGVLTAQVLEDGSDVPGTAQTNTLKYTFSRWGSAITHKRGPIDMNFASQDGSVSRYNGVTWDAADQADPQMIRAPMWPSGYPFGQWNVHIGL